MKSQRLLCLGLLLCCTAQAQEPYPFISTPVASFNQPWAMAFLPDGRLLVTEKAGTLQLVTQGGEKLEVSGVPTVAVSFQGGLADVVIHPDFTTNHIVYLSYSEAGPDDTSGAVIARGTLDLSAKPALKNMKVIWRALPLVSGPLQFGNRMAFDKTGHLFVSVGERDKKDPAQDMSTNLGKIVRLNDDGSPAADNPFANQGGIASEIWALGIRNPLGLAFDPDGRLWETEMGPDGGDELNNIVAGSNYGYPVVSNGNNYDGVEIPAHETHPEFAKPEIWWNPVISPSSLMFYTGDKFPDWNGNAFIGGLSSTALIRIEAKGADMARNPQNFVMGKRIRAVQQGPDGYIWLLEDREGGRLLKLTPRQ